MFGKKSEILYVGDGDASQVETIARHERILADAGVSKLDVVNTVEDASYFLHLRRSENPLVVVMRQRDHQGKDTSEVSRLARLRGHQTAIYGGWHEPGFEHTKHTPKIYLTRTENDTKCPYVFARTLGDAVRAAASLPVTTPKP